MVIKYFGNFENVEIFTGILICSTLQNITDNYKIKKTRLIMVTYSAVDIFILL